MSSIEELLKAYDKQAKTYNEYKTARDLLDSAEQNPRTTLHKYNTLQSNVHKSNIAWECANREFNELVDDWEFWNKIVKELRSKT